MNGPNRTIPLNVGLPLLENATLEEDNDLHDVWARLVVNGGDADSGIEIRRAFVSVLAEMTALDVRNLALIEQANRANAESASTGVWTYRLPAVALPFVQGSGAHKNWPSSDVLISLSNLRRLGCVEPGSPGYALVELTPFGEALVRACTYRREP